MKVNKKTFSEVHQPVYVLEEARLRRNLALIKRVADEADVEIILAVKAFALWKTFPIFREYIHATTASSLYEARLGCEDFGAPVHTFTPALSDDEAPEIARLSSHVSFNSLSQYARHHRAMLAAHPGLSLGLRVNPRYSEVETLLYNPCAPGTRFGVSAEQLPDQLPAHIEGFHCHCHCESGADVFARTLVHIEDHFAKWFPQIKWINFGGGHLMTRADYDVDALVALLRGFHARYPWLRIILEPGSAFTWRTGYLVSTVEDIVENGGVRTAMLDVSFACHMPDCLEMPYKPAILGARDPEPGEKGWRMGGNSCLAGDYYGDWIFDRDLRVGDRIVFEDMIHYTMVKTTMFNGVAHPSIVIARRDGRTDVIREFGYEDFRNRMS